MRAYSKRAFSTRVIARHRRALFTDKTRSRTGDYLSSQRVTSTLREEKVARRIDGQLAQSEMKLNRERERDRDDVALFIHRVLPLREVEAFSADRGATRAAAEL